MGLIQEIMTGKGYETDERVDKKLNKINDKFIRLVYSKSAKEDKKYYQFLIDRRETQIKELKKEFKLDELGFKK